MYPSFPTVAAILPPLVSSVDFVKTLIVPPTEDIASLEAPSPLCTCIAETTSVSPDQFDQKTLPFSMSLTGIPLIKTAVF